MGLARPRSIDFSYLTPAERLDLIGRLWDSLDPGQALELTPDLGGELDRRSAEADQDPDEGRSWEEIRADLEKRLR